jgi:hypothetical protein
MTENVNISRIWTAPPFRGSRRPARNRIPGRARTGFWAILRTAPPHLGMFAEASLPHANRVRRRLPKNENPDKEKG